jgi:preprotein translocase subunit SecB
MSEANNNPEQANQPQFAIQRIYLKDLSFETPNTPLVFQAEGESSVNVELNTATARLADTVFEVVLSLTVTNKLADKVAYLVEVQQAGIFTLNGFSDTDLNGMLHSYCPNILFPYVREVISNVVNKGSFPQLLLAPINFDAVYAQHLQQQAAAQDAEPVH